MLVYDEVSHNFITKIISFKINGVLTDDERMLILIPEEYIELFRNFEFRSYSQLSKALMFANCAHEGKMNNRPWIKDINESSLKSLLKKEASYESV